MALFLGVLFTLSMNISAVQANEMAFQMSMVAANGASGPGGCDGCGGGGTSPDAVSCPSLMLCFGVVAILPAASNLPLRQPAESFFPLSIAGRDLTAPPDPYPPKSPTFG